MKSNARHNQPKHVMMIVLSLLALVAMALPGTIARADMVCDPLNEQAVLDALTQSKAALESNPGDPQAQAAYDAALADVQAYFAACPAPGGDVGETASAVVGEIEPNNSLAGAQDINAGPWTLTPDPCITASTTMPHLSIDGTGDYTTDFFKFTVAAGTVAYFDIDYGMYDLDSMLRLWNSSGNLLVFVDDYGYDACTAHPYDSFFGYTFATAGTYTIEVLSYYNSVLYPWHDYRLQISMSTAPAAPNSPPVVAVDQPTSAASVDEGNSASATGTVSDPDGDAVSLSASLGTVVNNNDGTWSWSFGTNDGPNQSQSVTITADDGNGGISQTSFALTVNNVAPTITSLPVTYSQTLLGTQVTFTGLASDPSSVDTSAGFEWAWSVDAGPFSAFGAAGANTFTTSFATCGAHTVTAIAMDKNDGESAPFTSGAVNVYEAHFQQPLDEGAQNTVQKGKVIPVKITVACNGVAYSGLTPAIQLLTGDQTAGAETFADEIETLSVSAADTSGIMRPADAQYIYNLQVPNGSAGSLYTIRVRPFGMGADLRVVLKIRK